MSACFSVFVLSLAPACDKDDGDSESETSTEETSTEETTGGDDGGFWAVGGGSEMLRVADATILDGYDLGLTSNPDLNGIACRGLDEAWVVGDAGLVLLTDDGGQSWRATTAPTGEDLHGVAVALSSVAWAAGDNTIIRSLDDGETWAAHPTALAAPYRAISVEENGDLAFAVDTNGGLWRFTPVANELLSQSEFALNDVAVSDHGEHVLAVGQGANAMLSHDGGETFVALDLGLTGEVELHAGTISADGARAVIVGDQGVVAVVDNDIVHVQQPAGSTARLFDVHADGNGGIQIVGDEGRILLSDDEGSTWIELGSESGKPLYAIDSISGAGHH